MHVAGRVDAGNHEVACASVDALLQVPFSLEVHDALAAVGPPLSCARSSTGTTRTLTWTGIRPGHN